MTGSLPCAFVLLVTVGCSPAADVPEKVRGLQPPPVQKPVLVQQLALDESVRRDDASPLASVRLVELPQDETDTGASQLLGDGTLYRLELDRLRDRGAALVRFDDVAGVAPVATRIPLIAPAGQQMRTDSFYGGLRVASSTPGVLMDRSRRGSVWWEEDGLKGRLIEFRIDGNQATMVPPGAPLDDPNAPVARRFNRTPGREVPYRFTTGSVDPGPDVPVASLGGRGFSLALAPIENERATAFVESPASDLPHVDVAEPAPGFLTVTIGYKTDRGFATQVTYDAKARRWQDHRPLVVFPEAQGVEVADVGPSGVLANLILPYNVEADDPETGLYWIRRDQPVRHLLQRIRGLHTATLPDGFVALFEDEFREGRSHDDLNDVWVLRVKGERPALHRFKRPGRAPPEHFAWLGGNRFAATFGNNKVVVFELPEGVR